MDDEKDTKPADKPEAEEKKKPAEKKGGVKATISAAEKVLKRKKDPELQRKLQAEQLDFGGRAETEINEAIKKTSLHQRTALKRKKQIKYAGGALAALFVIYVGYGLFVPYKAGLTFGVCKIFLELNTRYPHTLKLSTVEELNNFVRIWYTQTNAFGEYRLESIQCDFVADEVTGGRISKISIDRREVDPERVAEFNKMLPIIFENPPDLTYPRPIPDRLEDMRIQTDLFRKPIF